MAAEIKYGGTILVQICTKPSTRAVSVYRLFGFVELGAQLLRHTGVPHDAFPACDSNAAVLSLLLAEHGGGSHRCQGRCLDGGDSGGGRWLIHGVALDDQISFADTLRRILPEGLGCFLSF